jgi:hypothetical protein
MKSELKKRQVVLIAKTIKGTSFVGLRNYESSSSGEVSNQTILVGIDYSKVLQNDLNVLRLKKDEIFAELSKEISAELLAQAYDNVLSSLVKRTASEEEKEALRLANDKTIILSDAQSNAYSTLAKGVRLHQESNTIHISGLAIRKEVLVKGEYKETKSRDLTIAQERIKKFCEFKELKFRNFKFNNGEVKIQGVTI